MKTLFNIIFLLFVAFSITGCSASKRVDNSFVYMADQPVPIIISDVITRRLITEYPPAKNRLKLVKSENTSFDDLLEHKLRTAGYTITNDADAIEIRYIIDLMDNTTGYLSLQSSRGLEFNQLFNSVDCSLADSYTEQKKGAGNE